MKRFRINLRAAKALMVRHWPSGVGLLILDGVGLSAQGVQFKVVCCEPRGPARIGDLEARGNPCYRCGSLALWRGAVRRAGSPRSPGRTRLIGRFRAWPIALLIYLMILTMVNSLRSHSVNDFQ